VVDFRNTPWIPLVVALKVNRGLKILLMVGGFDPSASDTGQGIFKF
jgi:hypothetical protein